MYPPPGSCNDENFNWRLEEEAHAWEVFYRQKGDTFYKDRHYFGKEFPELLSNVESGRRKLLEVGAGAGNTIFPLLELNPYLNIYACDFSPRAVEIIKSNPSYKEGRVEAFVADLTKDDLTHHIPPASVDLVTMIFCLSAISPDKMTAAISNVKRVLTPGGKILFRDYASGDLSQLRHEASGAKRISENFYTRGDQTRVFYFDEPKLSALFSSLGFSCSGRLFVHERDIDNHKESLTMHRRWIQGVFTMRDPAFASNSEARLKDTSSSVGWLVGAAGRLSNLHHRPKGMPSGRALLPETLDAAEEIASSISPSFRVLSAKNKSSGTFGSGQTAGQTGAGSVDMDELEREFYSTIARDSEVVAMEEEVASTISKIKLDDPFKLLHQEDPNKMLECEGAVRSIDVPSTSECEGAVRSIDVLTSSGRTYSFASSSQPSTLEILLASLIASCPGLFSNQRTAVHLNATSSQGIAAMAAIRSTCLSRLVVTLPDTQGVDRLRHQLGLNSSRIVIERLRAALLPLTPNESHLLQIKRQSTTGDSFDVVIAAEYIESLTHLGSWTVEQATAYLISISNHFIASPQTNTQTPFLLLLERQEIDWQKIVSAAASLGWLASSHAEISSWISKGYGSGVHVCLLVKS